MHGIRNFLEPSAGRVVISRKESSLREANLLLAPAQSESKALVLTGSKKPTGDHFSFQGTWKSPAEIRRSEFPEPSLPFDERQSTHIFLIQGEQIEGIEEAI